MGNKIVEKAQKESKDVKDASLKDINQARQAAAQEVESQMTKVKKNRKLQEAMLASAQVTPYAGAASASKISPSYAASEQKSAMSKAVAAGAFALGNNAPSDGGVS